MNHTVESSETGGHSHQSFWLWVMCLTGVDYFSTLGYQPSIAFVSAGMLAPLATVILVAVTLFGALPIYVYVAKKSFKGQGSIGMLAKLTSGWPSKVLVLVLLGFAATDFVITKTLSAADAAQHMIQNPNWPWYQSVRPLAVSAEERETSEDVRKNEERKKSEDRQRMIVTFGLLVLLGGMFMRGFREVLGLAVVLVGVYLLLNLIIVINASFFLIEHPDRIHQWLHRVETGDWFIGERERLVSGTSLLSIVAISVLIFPKLALGLSGFETGVAVMPLIKGAVDDTPGNPKGRIRNTRKLLVSAAAIMSFFLLTSSLIVCTLIPPEAFIRSSADDPAKKYALDRALAFLAHGEGPDRIALSGEAFGTIYDISTVVILWFAGASAMAGLLNLVPQYLPRYGMAPEWARAIRPLVLLLTGINLLVTWIFRADVEAQGGAYATGVLVLITSACVATVIERWRENKDRPTWFGRCPWVYLLITLVFVYTTAANVYEKPEGIKIAAFFIFTILTTSFISRIARSREMRFQGFHIPDAMSKLMWDSIKHLELSVLVPHRPGRRSLPSKESAIRREHRIPRDVMIIFVEVELADTSEFLHEPLLEVREEEGRYVMKISRAASIAHTLAAVALDMTKVGRPPEIHFGWTDETPWSGTLGFLLFGEGNIPWMVRELIRRAEPDPDRRPFIVVAGV
jgi:hypothetical protein